MLDSYRAGLFSQTIHGPIAGSDGNTNTRSPCCLPLSPKTLKVSTLTLANSHSAKALSFPNATDTKQSQSQKSHLGKMPVTLSHTRNESKPTLPVTPYKPQNQTKPKLENATRQNVRHSLPHPQRIKANPPSHLTQTAKQNKAKAQTTNSPKCIHGKCNFFITLILKHIHSIER